MKDMLNGKVAIVTGGFKGIGRCIAEKFASEGADLIVTTTRELDQVSDVTEILRSYGGKVLPVKLDVSDTSQVKELLSAAIDQMGGVDVLVNNAGITRDGLLIRMSEDDWDDVIRVDLKSAFNTCQLVLPYMMRKRRGSIINISSIVGRLGNVGQCNYSAAKAGLMGLASSIAKEMGGRGIRANCIAPGMIRTDMTAALPQAAVDSWLERILLKRIGEAEEVANVALFLASDMSTYVTAQVISCCGGLNQNG